MNRIADEIRVAASGCNQQHKSQYQIHESSCQHDNHSSPYWFLIKCTSIFTLCIFPFHRTKSANRKQSQRIQRFSLLKTKNLWPHTNCKFIDLNAVLLCCYKMPMIQPKIKIASKIDQMVVMRGCSFLPCANF